MMKKIFPIVAAAVLLCIHLPAQPAANKATVLTPFSTGNPKKWGYKNASGNIVVMPQYSKALAFIQGFALVNSGGEEDEFGFIKGGKWGMIDPSGKLVIPARYDMLHPFVDGMALFNIGGEYQMIEDTADIVGHNGLGGKWGYLDFSGKEKTPARYDLAFDFSDGLGMVNTGGNAAGCLLGNCGGLFGYIDKTGKEVIPLQFQSAASFAHGQAGVKKNGRKYVIDKKGNEVTGQKPDLLPVRTAATSPVPAGPVVFFQDAAKKYGLKDSKGTVILPPQFDAATDFKENGLARVGIGNFQNGILYGFINRSGQVVIPVQYPYAGGFSEGLVNVRMGDKEGYIDNTGKTVIPFSYENTRPFHEGLAAVQQQGKWGFIDKTGKKVLPFIYNNVASFQEGLALAGKNDKYGFIDRTGKDVIPFIYDYAYDFYEGLAAVNTGGSKGTLNVNSGKWGFINKSGTVVIPFQYDKAISFSEGLADVARNGKKGYIDKTGKEVLPFIYDATGAFSNGRAYVTLNGKGLYIDKEGKETRPYKKVNFTNGTYEGEVGKDGINPQGKGKIIWYSGDVYEGEFVNGRMHGKGKLSYADGKVLEGSFLNGKFVNSSTGNNGSVISHTAVVVPANSTAAVPEPFETAFRNAFNQASDAAGRGRALAAIIDNLHGSAYTEADKIRYISGRFREVYQMDFESAFQGLMKTNPAATTFFMAKVMPALPPEYRTAINRRARGIVDDYMQKHKQQP